MFTYISLCVRVCVCARVYKVHVRACLLVENLFTNCMYAYKINNTFTSEIKCNLNVTKYQLTEHFKKNPTNYFIRQENNRPIYYYSVTKLDDVISPPPHQTRPKKSYARRCLLDHPFSALNSDINHWPDSFSYCIYRVMKLSEHTVKRVIESVSRYMH